MSDYLPQEVLTDIFTKLPIKTLLQLRCVCKSWYSLITNPSFITTHINQTVTNNKTHLLLRHYTNNPKKEHYTLHCDDETFGEHHVEIEFPFKSCNEYFRIVGCCNGLICLSDDIVSYRHTIILWNPAIRKCVTLPRPRDLYALYGPYMFVLGFGFDPKNNDYKVVRVAYIKNRYGDNLIPAEAEVYTLSTGCWRSISAARVQYPLIEGFWSQAVVNGAVHWLGYNPKMLDSFRGVIVSFDMGDDVFGEMMLPDNLGEDYFYMSIAEYGGLLSLFQYDKPSWKKFCCIWVMKEYGVAESWTKQFNIDLQGIGKALGLRKNGELILSRYGESMLAMSDGGELISYDPATQKVKDIGIRGATRPFYVGSYLESLVLLEGENGELGGQAKSCDALYLQGRRRDGVEEGEKDGIEEQ